MLDLCSQMKTLLLALLSRTTVVALWKVKRFVGRIDSQIQEGFSLKSPSAQLVWPMRNPPHYVLRIVPFPIVGHIISTYATSSVYMPLRHLNLLNQQFHLPYCVSLGEALKRNGTYFVKSRRKHSNYSYSCNVPIAWGSVKGFQS